MLGVELKLYTLGSQLNHKKSP